ncbi:YybS family protein [Bacillus sp. DNRA2]|uniref:YybS family protein n=1 Tax=Bacillus sp. DNRA2 TaxID=2723053 RepID=UPI00145D609D|nr:YybS family protein [Bacillus sp. DNRA2]NMD72482.1 YybS family protein [Bacillus sp. DNRA2]
MKNASQLTKGAMFLAIYSIILLITLYIPLLGSITVFFLPLPFILFAVQNNLRSSLILVVGALLLSMILGTMLNLPLTWFFTAMGVSIGYLIRQRKHRWFILATTSFVTLFNTIVLYGVIVVFFKQNVIKSSMDMVEESYQMSFKMLESMGQKPSQQVVQQLDASLKMFETLMPSIFVIFSFMLVFFVMLISLPIIKRFGVKVVDWSPLRELSLPKSLLWYYLISMGLSLLVNPEPGTYFYIAIANLVFILQFAMIIQGVSLIFYYCHVKGLGKAVPIVIVVFSMLLPFLLYIVRIFGIIDLGFNLRNRIVKK